MGLLALDTFPLQSTLAQAVGRPEPEGGQADGSSCRLWERQGQGEQGGADEEQLLSFPRADGRPEDWHTIYFIHGKILNTILNTSQDRVKGNYESPPWPHQLYSSLWQVRTACD